MQGRCAAILALAILAAPAWAQQDRDGSAAAVPSPEPRPDAALMQDARPPVRPDDLPVPDVGSEGAAEDGEGQSNETARMPAPSGPPVWQLYAEDEFSYQSCLLGLSMLRVSYEEIAPLRSSEDRDCGIARPVRITEIQPGLSIAGGADMRCETARQLALWVRRELQPAVRRLPSSPQVSGIIPGSTYQCRARVGGSSEKLSEHALGNAFDVAGLTLSDGSEMMIVPRHDSGTVDEAVQKAIRHGACLYFTTVLGPGSNAAHDNHLHFDIAARSGGWRICE
ncbi:extensin-like domain-containing protein [Paracoccus aerodenitrificans]|uniref:extensin-like domain-containing protein n=1 Tax=Paracoccus aerodenitrificans TaxID=3017781 RepID=UPI0022F00AF9|nr:extensin family protein [Paracoccus aerodenitrificans]WBU63283.1 extensin family protein [Paracoccus aerodenitrificans]